MKIEIVKGTTYKDVLRWASPECIFKPITGITVAAPAVVTCPDHGLVDGWTVTFESVGGMREINEQRAQVKVIDTNTFSIPCLNTLNFKSYTSGGTIRYLEPMDLTDFYARMRIRPNATTKPNEWIELYSLTHPDAVPAGPYVNPDVPTITFPLITLDETAHTITRMLPIALTDTFDFPSASYTLKLFRYVGTSNEESIKVDSGTIIVK